VFHIFRKAEFDKDGLILSSSQFSLLPQLPKNEARFKSGLDQIKNNRLVNNDLNPETHCIISNLCIDNLTWPQLTSQIKIFVSETQLLVKRVKSFFF
jgi:hypothetical protein